MKKSTPSPLRAALAATAALGLALQLGCVGAAPSELRPDGKTKKFTEDPTTDPAQKPGATVGGELNTFNHMADLGANGGRDPFDILAQRQEEGPPEVRTRLHSCQKIQITALRNILTSLGVDLDKKSNPPSAGQLLKGGTGALGAANYDARVGETIVWSAAGAAKLFDIFVQAAPEIIANISQVPQCQVDGVGPEMFDADNKCNADALSCITGRPVTEEYVDICSNLVTSSSDIETGKKIAVATVLSAAHSCE
ncbi:MAG: hypothetical protein U0359_04590 [Byssovorax sp.]